MQTAASNSLILTDFSSSNRLVDSKTAINLGGFYQLIPSPLVRGVNNAQVFRKLGDKLVALAEQAHAFRQMRLLEKVSRSLVSLPLPKQQKAVGQYYLALCVHDFGRGNLEQSARMLDRAEAGAPPSYRLRTIQSLATNSFHRGDVQSASSLYREAGRFASLNRLCDPYATVGTQKMIAVINSHYGNHSGAVALLEDLFPLAHAMRTVQPHVYCDYLNSFAVELCEVGRYQEARNVSDRVIASPFAIAYPEWLETRAEIKLRESGASRSMVAVSQRRPEADNLVRLPAPERTDTLAAGAWSAGQPARVLSFLDGKRKLVKEADGPSKDAKNYKDMSGRELLLQIMELAAARERTDYELYEILGAIDRVLSKLKDPGNQ